MLQASQQLVDDEIARPVLIGNRQSIESNIQLLGLRLQLDTDVDVIDPQNNPYFEQHWQLYRQIMGRKGVTPGGAQYLVRTQNSIVAALLVESGQADAMIGGVIGGFGRCLGHLMDVIGKASGIRSAATMLAHLLPTRTLFICDAHINPDPSAEELAETALLCAEEIRAFGIEPKVALLSHSNFGSSNAASAVKVRKALEILHQRAPDLEAEGEMHADAALSEQIRDRVFPGSKLRGSANLLVMPNIDAANISVNLLKMLGGGVTVGPILVGVAKSAHVISQSATVRSLVNMSAVAIERTISRQ